jgi:antitoxin (DNA-binding transcriptional repressor) of toxin-antitoxin stability system
MRSVGIRELRQRASELLRLVQAGETVEVTDRGRPVAFSALSPTSPPRSAPGAAGEVSEAEGSIDDLPEPVEPTPGIPLPSQIISKMRDDGL